MNQFMNLKGMTPEEYQYVQHAISGLNEEQKQKAEHYKSEVDKSGSYDKPIVTEVTTATKFYAAEDYHQEYYQNNKNTNPYCSIVIRPKLEKFQKVFGKKVKSN